MRFALCLIPLIIACTAKDAAPVDTAAPIGPRPAGDAARGWDVLRYGGYVGGGVPKDLWFEYVGGSAANLLEREGDSARLSPGFNLFTTPEGVEVVGGVTCLGCHAGYVNGQFIPGLGNTFVDYTDDTSAFYDLLQALVDGRYGDDSPEHFAAERLVRGANAVAPYIITPFAGVSPAFSIERAVVTWRDPATLEWLDDPIYEVPDTVPASDTPPWWHVKKKLSLYYNGMGRGDYARLIEQTGVVAIINAEHAEAIDQDFNDVLAYLLSVEPPVYPEAIDADLAADGQRVFEASCAACHGTYSADPAEETYPGLRLDVAEVGTDPVYAEELAYAPFNEWLEASWYGQGAWAAEFDAALGYVAPPLDGVWATAPYLHNGSVPDLVALLDSAERPTLWSRSLSSARWDFSRVGLPWEAETEATRVETYDTRQRGFGNGGHTYGDALSADERGAVLEYLKTL